MSGIAGWIDYEQNLEACRDAVETITESISRRGPDTGEVWINGPAALGHRRLAIVDFEGGKQPMEAKEDGETIACLSYSGEIYNAAKLRDQLKSYGHQFRTRSDTEVVLRGFLEWGDEVAERLAGIFAFAIWDVRKQWLLLVRDQLGVKPLFYLRTNTGVLFGSEPKAILARRDVPVRVEIGPSRHLLTAALVPDQPIHQGMYEVPAGQILRLTRKGLANRRYRALETLMQGESPKLTSRSRWADLPRCGNLPVGPRPWYAVVNQQSADGLSRESADFESRFLENRKLIDFVAGRLLACREEAETAVRVCFETASRNPPTFPSDGAFRSWILRMVIDEALLILFRKSNGQSPNGPKHLPEIAAPNRVLNQ